MPDTRNSEQIERQAQRLHAVYCAGFGWDPDTINGCWDRCTESERNGWIALARAVRGAIDFENGAGPYPTANQADIIRKMRPNNWTTESFLSETQPYGEMIVLYWNPMRSLHWTFLIHPDGNCDTLTREEISR